jgi:aspartate carbamoyltransferase catalytic subunit
MTESSPARSGETRPGGVWPRFSKKHLLGIAELNAFEIVDLIDRAEAMVPVSRQERKSLPTLSGKTQINLFFENSTRTQGSFEIAGKRLGAQVMNMSVKTSSVAKGETLIDTAATLNAMRPDVIVVRHSASGAVQLLAQKVGCSVINAGDGTHEHPTQALLDALTIRRHKGRLNSLTVAICGDIAHSRVARSNLLLLGALQIRTRVIAPRTLLPAGIESMASEVFTDMREGLRDADVVMMLRLQHERAAGRMIPSTREYYRFYGLDAEKLAFAKPDAIVMHPGPMNRGVEIDPAIADGPRSVITDQVEMGVAVRMAVLDALLADSNEQNA